VFFVKNFNPYAGFPALWTASMVNIAFVCHLGVSISLWYKPVS